ncbi:hypothetical protein, partial [Mesorhizobium sp.]|uniref:hypothetical protein n=1 Tax=Mesorhizobium sp. TaxID=1871066 RepID=UPI002579694A
MQQGFATTPQAPATPKKGKPDVRNKQKGQPEDHPFCIRSDRPNAGAHYSLMVTTMPAPTVRPPSR